MTTRKTGFRKIENDIFEALITAGLTGACYQVVLTVIDKTLGYRNKSGYKEKASISLSDFERVTGLSRQSVCRAIKQARDRRIIIVQKNGTRPAMYTLNPDIRGWLTRQVNHPSRLDNQITPDWSTKSRQTSQHATPRTTHYKENTKENIKERGYDKEITPPHELSLERSSSTPPMSLSLYTPKGKAKANGLTNGEAVLPGEDRATLESDPSAPGSPSRGMAQ
jgi:phage replication O-like protein O